MHYGFIAQDVQETYPNLVRAIDTQGHLCVNYIEFIPLLLQTLKEQDTIIQQLQAQISLLEDTLNIAQLTIEHARQYTDKLLGSNADAVTGLTISYQCDNSDAYISIYDLADNELKRMSVLQNTSSINIPKGTLSPGIYSCSLIAKGELLDSRKILVP